MPLNPTKFNVDQLPVVTTVGNPGWDEAIPSEQATREAIAAIPASGGDVVGPAGATGGNLAVFDGATGKLIADGGAVPAGGGNVLDTGATTANHLAVWNGASDHTIKDGGAVPAGGGSPAMAVYLYSNFI